MTNCGANTESCCASLIVEGGTYYRTYDGYNPAVTILFPFATAADGGPTGEADPATVSNFRLDKYLVTVGRFRQFVIAWNNGAGYAPPAGSGKHTYLNGGQGLENSGDPGTYETGWAPSDDSNLAPTNANLICDPAQYAYPGSWTASAGSSDNLPITCVNWYEAFAFCIWDGGFLPSEAEWEYAAAGGSQQREYPWGAMDPGTINQYAIYGSYYDSGSIAPVGMATLGAGLWGQLDLEGEVCELNLDWWASFYADPSTDSAYLTTASSRIVRGSSFGDTANYLPVMIRYGQAPSGRSSYIGFRCARSP